MSDRPPADPDFDDLVGGGDLDPVEEERLRRVHDLLVAAGPPPDLSPALRTAGQEPPRARLIPLRRRRTLLLLAAAIAAVAFGAGYLVGARGEHAAYTVPMEGPYGARAEIVVFDRDAAGNWPMELKVSAVTLRAGVVYELWLTKDGEPKRQCGAFLAAAGRTTVPLNAPYRLRQFDGWVVVPRGSRTAVLWTAGAQA